MNHIQNAQLKKYIVTTGFSQKPTEAYRQKVHSFSQGVDKMWYGDSEWSSGVSPMVVVLK